VRLYNYFRSSASYRVRIALALKGLAYDYVPIHLIKNEQLAPAYRALAPAQLVPALMIDAADGAPETTLTQSLAIIEYLDETHPEPPLLPEDALGRARVRSLALDIACDIHPLDNLRVLRYLQAELKISDDDKNRWYRHWIETGLEAVERQLADHPATGRFCHGDAPGLADCALVPQIFNAQRAKCSLDQMPTVLRIFAACMAEPAFASTQPSVCPDAT
jgi:maleylacetoacetate isomerase